jgi:hypothetical protein
LNRFGICTGAAGRREEALAATQEAVDIRMPFAKIVGSSSAYAAQTTGKIKKKHGYSGQTTGKKHSKSKMKRASPQM